MKFKLSALLFLTMVCSIYAQQKGKITGIIFDKTINQSVPYATVSLKSGENIVTGVMSEDNGKFELTAPLNKYTIEVQFIGYQTFTKDFELTEAVQNFGTIYLTPEATTLEGVNIIAEQSTIEQKIDRKVINVGKDLTTAGATAGEIMNNIPSVNVDKDGKISLRGNENVRILIDGRPTNMSSEQVLKQIPSTSIKSIELITNPSAKYNPEGMSGIINIVLHKNTMDGFNGSVDTGATFSHYVKNTNSLNLNYRQGKLNFFGNGSYSYGQYKNEGDMMRTDIMSPTEIRMKSINKNYLYKIGMDYYINDNNTLSFYTNQSTNNSDMDMKNATTYPQGKYDDIFQKTNYNGDNKYSAYNLAYKHLFEKKGHTLDIEGNFSRNKSTNDGNYNTLIGKGPNQLYKDGNNNTSDLTTINVDYVNPLNDHTKLEVGAEARISRADNNFDSNNPLIPEKNRVINNKYDQDIFSAYVTFGQTYGKFNYQVGTRLESYKVESTLGGKTNFKDDYVTLYPSVYFGYTMSDNDMFNLSYSRRVDRPSISQTNPVRQFSTPLMTMVGNPELKPQFTNSVELNYTRMFNNKSSITAGVYYRRINKEINHVIYDDPDNDNPNALLMTFDNYKSNDAYGFELSANIKLTPWWDMQPAIDFSSIKQTGFVSKLNATNQMDFVERNITASAFNARLNSNFKASKNLRFNLFGFYRGGVDGITMDSKEMYKIDAGARYSLLENKLSISARVNDIFNTMKFKYSSQYPYASNGQFSWESRSVYVGVNYIFGGGKGRALQRKSRDTNTKQIGGTGGGLF
ncbi:TonB-dependent receptor [Myroides marinus]|uniref:outer membrane beta-barrel family protein n=1 Tax=Myroides marinus TaxID=703342 RepID=UPI0025773BF9|nr:outer membrane beta-barrel family protein [Myroides marinus]MDM1369676.1 TonB-dependent receptor [Myroides marinus]MDM1372991.1 TonB-dependent receptor [Myroides marinus]MDM1376651.1 TonB-dependent receptor [Myroides marinus]MDM1380322.1 TonB-dependent receptor [Myroides marinus]MDM1383966.1 TonB-dependent receptor [Myroides marinus]